MAKEILINNNGFETRIVLIEDGLPVEFWLERGHNSSIVGNIYKGRVNKVLPGLQAAFVDIGLDKSAFIHVSDLLEITEPVDKSVDLISGLLHQGQEVIVQVYKDQIGGKGARVTTQLSIPSRYLVMMPDSPEMTALSNRIADEAERGRLLDILQEINQDNAFGLIARTGAEQADAEALDNDFQFLKRLWNKVKQRIDDKQSSQLIYTEFSLAKRVVRGLLSDDLLTITIDSAEVFNKIERFLRDFAPEWQGTVNLYQASRPLFDMFNAEDEFERTLSRSVNLKSGGNLVFDQNEAMTTIDVNTGQYVGHKSLEETAFRTNLEAAQAIARQLRLRNISGIIVIDFIDMSDDLHRRRVQQTLEECLGEDSKRTNVLGFTALHLMEMTRKRTTESLRDLTCEPCDKCQGSGYIHTMDSTCFKLFREIFRSVRQFHASKVLIIASDNLVDYLMEEHSETLAAVEESLSKRIQLRAEVCYLREQYDMVLL